MDTSACPNSDPSCGDYGLVSGRITALAVNPAVSGGTDVWAGAADGGLWHSTDGGTTWVPALDAAATGTDSPAESIGAISFNPNDPSEMFVGTGEANGSDSVLGVGIYYSQDGGQTFTLYGQSLLSELGIAKIAVSSSLSAPYVLAAASNTYAVGNGGVYLSTDNTTWSPVISGVSATDVVYDPNTPTVAYAGLAAKFVKGSNGKVTSSPVMRSTQSGKLKSWTPVDLGLPNNTQIRRTTLGISADGTHIYAVLVNQNGDLQGGAIYYSTDSGKTWQALAVPSDMASDSGGDQWWYDSTITVNPTNSSDVYVGGVDIWWWGPGTSYSWTNVTSVYGIGPGANTYNVHPDQHAMANIPGSATFYDGNDGGVWKATPPAAGGWSFANLNGGGLDITQFYSGSIGMVGGYPQLYGGAQDNGESFSTAPFDSFNSPVQWSETFGGDGGDTAVDYTNNAIVYEEVFQGDMFKSTTTGSGQSWTEAINGIDICANGEGHSCPATPYDSVSEVMPFVLSPSNHNELFAGTDRVYQTTDGANTWTAISPQLDPYPCTSSCDTNVCNGTVNSATCYWPLTAVAVAPNSDAQLYAGDQHGNIFATSAGFSGWTTAGTGTPSGAAVTGLAVDPTDSLIVYATYAGYLGDDVYQSKDGGGDWSSISGTTGSGGLPPVPFESVVVNPLNPQQVIAASDAGVYIGTAPSTSNGSWTWKHLGTGLPDVEVSQVFFNPSGTTLFLATHGRGMWALPMVYGNTYVGAGQSTNNQYLFDVDNSSGDTKWATLLNADAAAEKPTVVNGIAYWWASLPCTGDPSCPPSGDNTGLYAFNASTGGQLWEYATNADTGGTVATVANGAVYFATYQNVYALNASTGALLWQYTPSAVVGTQPAVDANAVYFGAEDGKEYALDITTGALKWAVTIDANTLPSPSTAANGLVYVATNAFGNNNNQLYALNASDGSVSASLGLILNGITSAPLIANGDVYFVGTSDNYLYAYSANLATKLWAFRNGQYGAHGTPAADNGKIFVISDSWPAQYLLYAVDASSGTQLWHSATSILFDPDTANGVVYGSSGLALYAFDEEGTGLSMWTWDPPPALIQSPLVGAPSVGR